MICPEYKLSNSTISKSIFNNQLFLQKLILIHKQEKQLVHLLSYTSQTEKDVYTGFEDFYCDYVDT